MWDFSVFLACDVGIDFGKGGLDGGREGPTMWDMWDMWDFTGFLDYLSKGSVGYVGFFGVFEYLSKSSRILILHTWPLPSLL